MTKANDDVRNTTIKQMEVLSDFENATKKALEEAKEIQMKRFVEQTVFIENQIARATELINGLTDIQLKIREAVSKANFADTHSIDMTISTIRGMTSNLGVGSR